ncbi:MAG: hypothetical protein C4K58_00810 [Flavobacteriaceae bacterium]|nr:MAG: hypothetical protein C4K58_00810 [Flavobacteriaceae bacterium]
MKKIYIAALVFALILMGINLASVNYSQSLFSLDNQRNIIGAMACLSGVLVSWVLLVLEKKRG